MPLETKPAEIIGTHEWGADHLHRRLRQGGDQGFQDLKEGEEVHYRVFNDKIDSIRIARDVWKKHDGGKERVRREGSP
jgi:hypothetical protein